MSTFAPYPVDRPVSQQADFQPNPRLFPEEAEALLQALLQGRWQRLSSEYHDPLGMLFGNRARQWTAGWDQDKEALLLLVWETDSWQEKPIWSLYRNGQRIFQEEDGFSRFRSGILHQLLESEALPFVMPANFLAPLTDFRYDASRRERAGQMLMRTIQARPEVLDHLREPLLQALEADLDNPDWPVLDILKLHRVAHKTVLVDLFRQCVEIGLFRVQNDQERLDRVLNRLQAGFDTLNHTIAELFRPALHAAQSDLKRILTAGHWRVSLYSGIQG